MKQAATFKGAGVSLALAACFKGNRAANWDASNYNHYRIYVSNVISGARTSFEFWASRGVPRLADSRAVLGALECFISDAIAGGMSREEFCSEFGYEDGREGARVWRACVRSAEKLERVFGGADFGEVLESLREEFR